MDMRTLIALVEDAGETPLQRWFAGSKLVDADGRPIKLYHGTSKDQDFRSFKVPKNGVWFTSDPTSASDYAQENDSQDLKYKDGKFVRVHTASRVLPCFVRMVNPVYLDAWPESFQVDNYKRAQAQYFDQLRVHGHDGVVFQGGKIVVVLGSPNQIKSAVGNVSFHPDKKNIDESAGEPAWYAAGAPVDDPAAVNDDCNDILEPGEWDLDWRLCDVPLDVIDVPNPDFRDEARLTRLRNEPLHAPAILRLTGERAQLLDGAHRLMVARERGQTSLPALVGGGEADLTEAADPGLVRTEDLPPDIRDEAEGLIPDDFYEPVEIMWRLEDIDVQGFAEEWDYPEQYHRNWNDDDSYIEQLGQDLLKNGQQRPLVIGPMGTIEGNHRMLAALECGIPTLKAWVAHLVPRDDGDDA